MGRLIFVTALSIMYCAGASAQSYWVDCTLTDLVSGESSWIGGAGLGIDPIADEPFQGKVGKFSASGRIHIERTGSDETPVSKITATILNDQGQTLAGLTASVFDVGTYGPE